jgi:2-polyprenyl-3-methyl-5-hydroxy-6-metoxy-1,4-benzoquinol methylase
MTHSAPADVIESARFYEDRYRHGYMGYWSDFEQERIFNLVKSLQLPDRGRFLDFGCGRGIFTNVISKALPNWEVFGCDVSETAIEVALQNNPHGKFYLVSSPELKQLRFDFIHSHHVLEHTADLDGSIRLIISLAAERCKMLHSLPCNHEGSLEQRVSSAIPDGINKKTGTFFFEDTAHLRRMSESELTKNFTHAGFILIKEKYANQYFGAVKWISESNLPLVLNFTRKNAKLRMYLLFTWFCFFIAGIFDPQDRGRFYYLKRIVQFFLALLFFWLAFSVRAYINYKAKKEWKNHSDRKNGSEMFLAYSRGY